MVARPSPRPTPPLPPTPPPGGWHVPPRSANRGGAGRVTCLCLALLCAAGRAGAECDRSGGAGRWVRGGGGTTPAGHPGPGRVPTGHPGLGRPLGCREGGGDGPRRSILRGGGAEEGCQGEGGGRGPRAGPFCPFSWRGVASSPPAARFWGVAVTKGRGCGRQWAGGWGLSPGGKGGAHCPGSRCVRGDALLAAAPPPLPDRTPPLLVGKGRRPAAPRRHRARGPAVEPRLAAAGRGSVPVRRRPPLPVHPGVEAGARTCGGGRQVPGCYR